MYNTGSGVAAGAAGLPATGMSPVAAIWIGLASFAIASAGGAIVRVAPSLHRAPRASHATPTVPRARVRG
jgi:hypothetical protein